MRWAVEHRALVRPHERRTAPAVDRDRDRIREVTKPLVTEQKIPLVQMPPTCMTLDEADDWLNFGVAAVPFVVWANVTYHGDCSASLGVSSGEFSQMKSTRPVEPAATQGKKCVPLSLLALTGADQVRA